MSVPRRLKHVQSSFDVGVHIRIRRMVAERYRYQRGKVENHIDILHRLADTVRVADVACEHVNAFEFILGKRVHPAPRVERIVAGEGPDRCALPYKRFDKMRTDEAVGSGDENSFFRQIHSESDPGLYL
ncbi:hypothetical protein SDC9_211121 [bioreactor metagenome]|uniref:Uncharacterized protein n=1 Tax=bioreactor metagenome TaxID=1076179 RepID=A0A645JVY4_9ZZZZ